jgi:aminopeptidase N
VWVTIAGILSGIENILAGGPENFQSFGRSLFEDVWARCGWVPKRTDSHSDVLLRSLVIGRLGHFQDTRVIGEARRLFEGAAPVDPNLRSAIYGLAAEHGDERTWRRLDSLYRKTDHQEEKVRVLRALTRFRDPGVVSKVLHFSLSGDVRPQDAYVILAGFGSNLRARASAWAFVRSHWKKIAAMYRSGSVGLLGRILEGATSAFSEPEEFRAVRAFFRAHPVPGTERVRRQTLEIIRSNIAWKRREARPVSAWLERGFFDKIDA